MFIQWRIIWSHNVFFFKLLSSAVVLMDPSCLCELSWLECFPTRLLQTRHVHYLDEHHYLHVAQRALADHQLGRCWLSATQSIFFVVHMLFKAGFITVVILLSVNQTAISPSSKLFNHWNQQWTADPQQDVTLGKLWEQCAFYLPFYVSELGSQRGNLSWAVDLRWTEKKAFALG